MSQGSLGRTLLPGAAVLAMAFNVLPLLIVVPISFGASALPEFPPRAWSLRWYAEALSSQEWRRVALVSLLLALAVAAVSVSICFLAALVTTRRHFRFRGVFELLVVSPLLLPQAATALVLFWLVGALGWRGTLGGIAAAHVVLCIPFAYRPLATALRHADRSMEEAAMTLGAPPWRVFLEVVLPGARKALLTAFLFTALLSFDEVTVTAFLVGIDQVTLPVAILQASQDEASPLLAAIATVLIGVTLLVVLVAGRLAGLKTWSAAPP